MGLKETVRHIVTATGIVTVSIVCSPDDSGQEVVLTRSFSPSPTPTPEKQVKIHPTISPEPTSEPTLAPTPAPTPEPIIIPTVAPVPAEAPVFNPGPTVIAEPQPPPLECNIYFDSLCINGNEAFVNQTHETLIFLRDRVPDHYQNVLRYIKMIKNIEAGSGMDVFNQIFYVGNLTAFPYEDSGGEADEYWYASTIVHDAVHSEQYVTGVPYLGKEAEISALDRQRQALTLIGPASVTSGMIDYITNLINTANDPNSQYWNNPNRHWRKVKSKGPPKRRQSFLRKNPASSPLL